MIQVKLILSTGNHIDLEKKINEFLKVIQANNDATESLRHFVTIRDIKLNHSSETKGYDPAYTAMVIYDDGGKV